MEEVPKSIQGPARTHVGLSSRLVPSHFHLRSIPLAGFLAKIHRPNTRPTPLVTPKSRPPSTSLYLGSAAPPCQAPGLCSTVVDVVVAQADVRHGLVDLQRFGEGLWPKRWRAGRLTMRSMRTFVTRLNYYVMVGTNKKLG